MIQLNYKNDLLQLQNFIADQTLRDNADGVQLLVANLNSLYGMMLSREGIQTDVFPILSPERAVKFLVSVQSMAAFQLATTIVDHLLEGSYSEAAALLRSLVEVAAFCEYYLLCPDVALSTVQDVKSLPTRSAVFRMLKKFGSWPVGGPRKTFERYNQSAHAHIAYVLQHSAETEDGPPSVSRLWLRRFSQESFYRLARDMILPLIAVQEIYRRIFFDDGRGPDIYPWKSYWSVGHNRTALARVFPTLTFGSSVSSDADVA